MKRAEAEKLVGKTVTAWTACNGEYVGILREVVPSKPWRAKVEITGVLAVAVHFEQGQVCRRGKRPGETIEVGGSSVGLIPEGKQLDATDYLSALQRKERACLEALARDPEGQYSWANRGTAQAIESVVEAERRRIATGEWRLAADRATATAPAMA